MREQCQRRPPDGWPGNRCTNEARYGVTYKVAIVPELRHIKVCEDHLKEMNTGAGLGVLRDLTVKELGRRASVAGD